MGNAGVWLLVYAVPGVLLAALLGSLAQTGLLGARLARTKSFAILVVFWSTLVVVGLNGPLAAEVLTGIGCAVLSMLFFEPGWMLASLTERSLRRVGSWLERGS